MKRLLLSAILLFIIAGSVSAYSVTRQSYLVESIGLGDGLDKVFKALGAPQAIQVMDDEDKGALQLLYFRKEDTLTIDVSDLPDNKVTQIDVSGTSWNTTTPVKVGDKVDGLTTKIGKPDKVDDLTVQKLWMMEQAGGDTTMRHLIEKNSGDTGFWYQHFGLYIEYDKSQNLVKSVRIYDPLSRMSVKVNKL